MHPAICNGSRSQKGRQRINGNVKGAKSKVQWIIRMVETVTIPILAQTQPHPTVPTSVAQEAAAIPLRPVVTSVMSPIPFVGSNPSRIFSVDDSLSI